MYEKDFYWYLKSQEFANTFLYPLGNYVNKYGNSVLDVGCGEGQLSDHVYTKYTGVDASIKAIEKAKHRTKDDGSVSFFLGRLEEFKTWELIPPYDVVVFGGIMEVLVEPCYRAELALEYLEWFHARILIIYDLERLDHSVFDRKFECLEELHGRVRIKGLIPQKEKRKILVYKKKE